MRKIFLLLILLGTCLAGYAQDTITKRNGDEIQARVLEITLDAIKYKRFDNLEGPTIYISKGDVFMIVYENGTKETFTDYTSSPSKSTTLPPAGTRTSADNQIPIQQELKLSGPRVGFTILSQRYLDYANSSHLFDEPLKPFVTQFGWQFETRFFTLENGASGLLEIVPLIGGVEQGKFLPSLSALLGYRGRKGTEIGIGPNITLSGAALVLAAGTNFQSQGINFPVNIAVVPSQHGVRTSLLIGFNSRKY